MTKVIGAIGLGKLAKDFISTGVQYNAEIEKYQTALSTLLGSTEKANKVIEQIKKDAATTPFDVSGLTQANQLLISTGLSADESRETILALGNAVSATGGGNDELSRMALNLQQVKNLGKASSIDIKQFAMAGIDIYGLLADYLGITKEEASEMTVTWDDLNGALISASKEGGKYFGAMEKQSETLNGQWSTLKDNFKEFAGEAMEPLTNFLKDHLLPALNDMLTNAKNIGTWIDEHKTAVTVLTGIIGTLTAAIIAYTIAKNADLIVIALYCAATGTATAVTTAFGAVLAFITSPVTLVVLAIGALITIIVLLVKNWDTVKEKALEVWSAIKEFVGQKIEDLKKFFTETIPNALQIMINWFKELPSKIWTYLVNVVTKIITWKNNLVSKGQEAAKSLLESVVNGIKSLPDKIKTIGSNMVKGLWNGISNVTSWLWSKISGFCSNILSKIKGFFGIHSPSKVFSDEVGKFLGLGLGEGFEDSLPSVYKDMQAEVDFQTQKLSANLSTTASIGKVLNANITLQPSDIYMDSTKVGRAITPTVTKTLRGAGAY